MHKQFIPITLLVTIIALLLLTSCSVPVATPTLIPTATIARTPVVTATPMPTATPRTEPYSAEECEKILEALIDTDVTYKGDSDGFNLYYFTDKKFKYTISYTTGHLVSIRNKSRATPPTSPIDKKEAQEHAIDEANKFCPNFFLLDTHYETRYTDNHFCITMHQLSPLKRRTGNFIQVEFYLNGELSTINIHDTEDISICDQDFAITQEEAIEIAYEACQIKINELTKADDSYKIYLDEKDNHQVTVSFFVNCSRPIWHVEIKNIRATIGSNKLTKFMEVMLHANTGELISIGY